MVEGRESLRDSTVLNRPLLASLTVNWELAAYAGLVIFALATRLWDLGSRALHHDESLHAIYSWYLYVGRGYQHDPMMHGPFLFHANALVYLLLGASDYTARVLPALFGVWVVIAPYFLRREMGRVAALAAAALFAVSPSFLYFSRFIRNDIYMAGWAMMIVIGLFGYLRERKAPYLYLLSVGTAFSFATKETVYITGFAFALFLILEALVARIRHRTSALWTILSTPRPRDWAIVIVLFLAIEVVLYTTFFTNPKGLITGTWGALSYWLSQHGVQRGGQPWFYYLMLIPLYEYLAVIAALGGMVFVTIKKQWLRLNLFTWFCIAWLLITTVVYSWAGEKMPWLDLHLAQPLILLAALTIAGLLKRANRDMFVRQPGLLALAFAGLLAAVVIGGMVAAPPLAGTELGMQTAQLQRIAMWLLAATLLIALLAIGRRHGNRVALVPAGLGGLVALLALTVGTAFGVTYARGDIPREMLVYVQSSPDVPRVVQEIERLSQVTATGKDIKILLDGGYTETVDGRQVSYESVSWPFEWYLRDYRNKSYYSKTFSMPTDAAVIIAMVSNEGPILNQVSNYVPVRGRLNWWYPEDYKGLTLEKMWEALRDPSIRGKLWRYFLYKETLNPLGSRDFDFFVRSDLAKGVAMRGASTSVAPAPVAQAPTEDAVAQEAAGGITIFGKTRTGGNILSEPRDVAIGPDGTAYVVDAVACKVVAFRPDGTVAYQWGRKGAGDGEFNEPWGIAVAPGGEIYVADTWNHRIQKFDATGRFLAKWGRFADIKGQVDAEPGTFWGPRDVAITPGGRILVTDTGNKRVQQFDADGRFISLFGGEGSDPGRFKEPVGIAVDAAGNLYVADTWNERIQKFDAQYQPLAQFRVQGWESHSIINKPYLAVDREGRILYTEPERHQLSALNPAGLLEGSKGSMGAEATSFNLPVGIAVSPQGELFVADSRNARVVRYQAWR